MGSGSNGKNGKQLHIGIDLGGTNIQAGVLNSSNKLLSRSRKKTKATEGLEVVIDRVVCTAGEAVKSSGASMDDIAAVGIGAPGAIDENKGIVRNAPNLCWNDVPLADILSEKMKVPVVVDNDVNCGTWAEYQLGVAREFDSMLGVFIGTGIGGGLVFNGKLYHGYHHTAGEIGHTIIHADAVLGRRTLENAASRTAVVNLLKQLILSNQPSILMELTGGKLDSIRSKILAEAFEAGDELTNLILRRAASYVGLSIANTVTMLSLPAAVVGGGLMEALGGAWLNWVRESFREYVFPPELAGCKILESELGDDANVIGAALLARK